MLSGYLESEKSDILKYMYKPDSPSNVKRDLVEKDVDASENEEEEIKKEW